MTITDEVTVPTDFTVLSEREVRDWGKSFLSTIYAIHGDGPELRQAGETLRQGWIAWTERRKKIESFEEKQALKAEAPEPESHICPCGNEIVRATGRGKWAALCQTCRDAEVETKAARLNATVLCECGNEIPRPKKGKRASRCETCREQAKVTSAGKVKVCESCSKEFTATGKGSHWVKRCPDCRG